VKLPATGDVSVSGWAQADAALANRRRGRTNFERRGIWNFPANSRDWLVVEAVTSEAVSGLQEPENRKNREFSCFPGLNGLMSNAIHALNQ